MLIPNPCPRKFRLKRFRFSVKDFGNCWNNTLEIFGVTGNGQRRLIKKYCGQATSADYTHPNNRLDLVFTSNLFDQYSGFSIEYNVFERATTKTTTTATPAISGKYV